MKWRRDQANSRPSAELSTDEDTSGKGRPTPSRKEAEAERKERLKATARGEDSKRSRPSSGGGSAAATRSARSDVRKRVLAGDESALTARDRGPERRFARDFVDSRYTVGEYFLYLAILVLILGIVPATPLQILSQFLLLVIVFALAADSFRIYRSVGRALTAKFPTSELKGVARYAVMRGMVTRRMRVPKPQAERSPLFRTK